MRPFLESNYDTLRLPEGAHPFTREGVQYAEWKGRDGRKRTGEVKPAPDGSLSRLVLASRHRRSAPRFRSRG